MAVTPNEFTYKYDKGDTFALTITSRMPKQSNLEDEVPVYHTNAGIPMTQTELSTLTRVQETPVDRYMLLTIYKTNVDDTGKSFFPTWSEAYIAMVQKMVSSYKSSDDAEKAFNSGAVVMGNYSMVSDALDIRIVEVS